MKRVTVGGQFITAPQYINVKWALEISHVTRQFLIISNEIRAPRGSAGNLMSVRERERERERQREYL
jgi:hypothetical protein